MKPTYRKSWAGNLLMLSHLHLEPLLQVQMRIANLKTAYNSLIIGLCNMKPTCGISLAGNLLMFSDLTFGPSFKVKQ